MRMLIIDDSATMRRYLASIAALLRIENEQAADGVEGIERLETSPPYDVALVDWSMPRMDGLEFVKSVRARPEYQAMKLLMVTSRATMEDVNTAILGGADDYLMKPLTDAMLADKLRLLGLLE